MQQVQNHQEKISVQKFSSLIIVGELWGVPTVTKYSDPCQKNPYEPPYTFVSQLVPIKLLVAR